MNICTNSDVLRAEIKLNDASRHLAQAAVVDAKIHKAMLMTAAIQDIARAVDLLGYAMVPKTNSNREAPQQGSTHEADHAESNGILS